MATELNASIRVLLADDHFVVREGLCAVLKYAADVKVVAQAENGEQAVQLFRVNRPDVTLMDLRMPQLDGIAATRMIMAENPYARVLMLTTDDTETSLRQCLDAGARGYLLKTAGSIEMYSAIQAVFAGETVVPKWLRRAADTGTPSPELSARQHEVLELLVRGLSNKQIAAALGFTTDGTKAHLKTIYARLGVQDRTEAVVAAIRRGLVAIPP